MENQENRPSSWEEARNRTGQGYTTFGRTDTGSFSGASSDSTSGNMAGSMQDSGGANRELISREDSKKGQGYDGVSGDNRDRRTAPGQGQPMSWNDWGSQNRQSGSGYGHQESHISYSQRAERFTSDRDQGYQHSFPERHQEREERRNSDQPFGQQRSGHWDRSYDSRKNHGMYGNRNNPDWRNSSARPGEGYGGPGGARNQRSGPELGGNVYHAGGENRQGYRQPQEQSNDYRTFGSSRQDEREAGFEDRRQSDRSGNYMYGAGSYAGELDRDYGQGGSFRGDKFQDRYPRRERPYDYGTSGYDRFQDMGGYDRSHSMGADMNQAEDQRRSYSSPFQEQAGRYQAPESQEYQSRRSPGQSSGDYTDSADFSRYQSAQRYNNESEQARQQDWNSQGRSEAERGGYRHEVERGGYRHEKERGGYRQDAYRQQEEQSRRYGSFEGGRNAGDRGYGQYSARSAEGYQQESERDRNYDRNDHVRGNDRYGANDYPRMNHGVGTGYAADSGSYGTGRTSYREEDRDSGYGPDRSYERGQQPRNQQEGDQGFIEKAVDRVKSWLDIGEEERNR